MSDRIREMIEGGRHLVPPHMWSGVENYFVHRIPVGSFLEALFSGASVMDVVAKADDVNCDNLRNWCVFLYNHAPAGSYGSIGNYRRWLGYE